MLQQDSNPWTLLYTTVYCMHAYTFFKYKNVGQASSQAECSYFSADFSLQYSCIILEL